MSHHMALASPHGAAARPGAAATAAPVALVVLVLLAALLPESLQAQLAWQRAALADGEVWRLWTGHLVHHGSSHALTNAASLLLLACWSHHLADPVRAKPASPLPPASAWASWLAVLLALPLLSLALLAVAPGMSGYRGASALVMLFAGRAAVDALRHDRHRLAASLMLGALGLEIIGQAAGWPMVSSLPPGVAVAWPAHLVGGSAGALWALLAPAVPARRPESLPHLKSKDAP